MLLWGTAHGDHKIEQTKKPCWLVKKKKKSEVVEGSKQMSPLPVDREKRRRKKDTPNTSLEESSY